MKRFPPLRYSELETISASPEAIYDLVSDVTRTGEWSPTCKACWWHDKSGPHVGGWFSGRNEANGRTWKTESQVAVAQPGREFAWLVGGSLVRWGYTFLPVENGTQVTESWEFRSEGIAMFNDKYGRDAGAKIEERAEAAHADIPRTLNAIKRIAESS